jgi:hypothetical protein
VQPGVTYLASRLGLPVVATGFGFDRPWRCGSWDRFVIPRPFTRACCVMAAPIAVPAYADRRYLEAHRARVEVALHHVSALAERWAEDGTPPEAATLKRRTSPTRFNGRPDPPELLLTAPCHLCYNRAES